jgi:hypothetical protein
VGIKNLHVHGSNLHDGRRKTLLRPSTRHDQIGPLFLSLGARLRAHDGLRSGRAKSQTPRQGWSPKGGNPA